MSISPEIIRKVEKLLNTKITELEEPSSGFDHTVFSFRTQSGEKLLAKAEHSAIVDALVIESIMQNNLSIPVPRTVASSREDKIAIFEFVQGVMLETLPQESILELFPSVLLSVKELRTIRSESAGGFLDVHDGGGGDWKSFFGLKYTDSHSYYTWELLLNDKRFDPSIIKKALGTINESINTFAELPSYSLVHGDLHGGNIIVDQNEIKAIIDWSDAIYGDPLYDYSRIRLFLVNESAEMSKIYYDFLNMSTEEKEREEVYYLAHVLRILFFAVKENIEDFIVPNYKKLQDLMS